MSHLEKAIPRRVSAVDVLSLPLTSVEAFVLSRIDGITSSADLADIVGLPREEVDAAVARLLDLGAIEVDGAGARSPSVAQNPASGREDTQKVARGQRRRATDGTSPSASASSGEAPEEEVDLDEDRRNEVRQLFERLKGLSHYELLGVPDHAEKGEIKSAYFRISKRFHPDTMYGRRLGSYKPRMEAIFNRATEAHDVLTRRRRREAYDESIGLRPFEERVAKAREQAAPSPEGAAGAAAKVTPPGATSAPGREATGAVRTERRGSSPRISEPASSVRPRPRSEHSIPKPSGRGSVGPSAADSERMRRVRAQQLADAAGKSNPPSERRGPSSVPSSRSPSSPAGRRPGDSAGPGARPSGRPSSAARNSLLRGLASSLKDVERMTGTDRTEKLMRQARDAESRGDLVGASNALRLVAELDPSRKDAIEGYRRIRKQLAVEQADSYEQQAKREEHMKMFGAAALSWSKVAEGRPSSAHAHSRAAHCLWKSDGDLKKARDLALRAIQLEPGQARHRLTLGQIYAAAGMKVNARKALEEAAKLDPNDDIVKNLLRDLKS